MTLKMSKSQKSAEPCTSDQVFANLTTPLEAADCYLAHGLSPIPLLPKSKKPKAKWKDSVFDPKTDGALFDAKAGIALKLGLESGGLVDVDLDCSEARQLAKDFLPETPCVFGRESAPGSHWGYLTYSPLKTKKFQVKLGGETSMLLELRGEKHLTRFPPSVHESGQVIRFEPDKAAMPGFIGNDDLIRSASQLAVAALWVHVWPKTNGIRQDVAMALAGGMLRAGYDAKYVENFIHRVTEMAGDEEAVKRGQAAQDTAAKIDKGLSITGWPKLEHLLGSDGKEIVAKSKEWLGITGTDKLQLGQGKPNDAKIKVTTANLIKPKAIKWFWPNFIPSGAITILDGDPGTGKSTIALDLAARQSAGTTLPDGTPCDSGDVLILSAEDDEATTIVPRLKAADADMSRVHIMNAQLDVDNGIGLFFSLFRDIELLSQVIVERNVKLLVIDPMVAFLGAGTHQYDDQSIRTVFGPVRALAEATGLIVLGIRHLNKKEGISALYRGSGSIGMIGVARSGLLAAIDPKDPATSVLAILKSNLSRKNSTSWRYSLESEQSDPEDPEEWEAGVIKWMGETDISAQTLVDGTVTKMDGAFTQAKEFIREVLANGSVPASEVFLLAEQHGHAKKTLSRAATKLGVKKKQFHEDGKIKGWLWSLPEAEEGEDQEISDKL